MSYSTEHPRNNAGLSSVMIMEVMIDAQSFIERVGSS